MKASGSRKTHTIVLLSLNETNLVFDISLNKRSMTFAPHCQYWPAW